MKLRVSPGRLVARDPLSAFGQQVGDTQRAVREVAARAGELTGAVIRHGLTRIVDFGGLVVEGPRVDPATGNPTGMTFGQFRWGALPDDPLYNHPDGTPQMGWLAYRDDGTLAMAIAELRANDGQYAQAVLWFDRKANIIVSEDTHSGRGLARPHIPWSTPQPTNTAQWLTHTPSAGDTSWTSIARVEVDPDNAAMWWNVTTLVDAGVTAQYRWCWQLDAGAQAPVLVDAAGGDVTHTNTATGSYNFAYWRRTSIPFPAGVVPQRRTTLDLQVRMTVGADGTRVAKASVIALGGDQS